MSFPNNIVLMGDGRNAGGVGGCRWGREMCIIMSTIIVGIKPG